MKVILVERKSSKELEGYRTLTKACKALGINYNTITKVINGSCDVYENSEVKIKRLPIQ